MRTPEPKEKRTVWTDGDVAEFFRVNVKTLQRRLRKPVAGELDLNRAEPGIVGGRRFWIRDNVYRVAGIKV